MATHTAKKRPKKKALHVASATPITSDVQKIFRQSLRQWKEEEKPTSFMMDRLMHPAYQRIIGLGPAAVPLILRQLQKEPDPWFWALEAITGERLDPESDSYRFSKTVEMWLQWGRKRGYLA